MNKWWNIRSEKGISLVEVLAVVAVSSIVLMMTYQLVFNSYKSSRIIEANNDLREEGDALLAFFLKELHTNRFDYINLDETNQTDNKITDLVLGKYDYALNNKKDTLLKTATTDYYKISLTGTTTSYSHVVPGTPDSITVLNSMQPNHVVSIKESSIDTTCILKSNIFQNREVNALPFQGCESGVITLRFTLQHNQEGAEKEFVSKIGF